VKCGNDPVLSGEEIRLLRLGRLTPGTVAQHRKRRLEQHDATMSVLLEILFFLWIPPLFKRRKNEPPQKR